MKPHHSQPGGQLQRDINNGCLYLDNWSNWKAPIYELGPVGLGEDLDASPEVFIEVFVDIRRDMDALLDKNLAGGPQVDWGVVV